MVRYIQQKRLFVNIFNLEIFILFTNQKVLFFCISNWISFAPGRNAPITFIGYSFILFILPLAIEANIPKKQSIVSIIKVTLMLIIKLG